LDGRAGDTVPARRYAKQSYFRLKG
jgi:hypothetical protein